VRPFYSSSWSPLQFFLSPPYSTRSFSPPVSPRTVRVPSIISLFFVEFPLVSLPFLFLHPAWIHYLGGVASQKHSWSVLPSFVQTVATNAAFLIGTAEIRLSCAFFQLFLSFPLPPHFDVSCLISLGGSLTNAVFYLSFFLISFFFPEDPTILLLPVLVWALYIEKDVSPPAHRFR